MASIRKHRGKWQVQIRRRGASALSKSFTTKKDAETWARQTEVLADRQDLPKNPRQLEQVRLRDLVIRYRDEVTPRKRGRDVETIVFNAFLRHPICQKRLSELTPADFGAYRDERLRKVKPNTLRREFAPLHNLFETARKEWGLAIKENPLDSVKFPCPPNRRERRLREGELQRIIDATKRGRNTEILPLVLLALETSLRRSELLAARWNHIDLKDRLLSVPRAKNGHSRVIPLTRTAVGILEGLRRASSATNDNSSVFQLTPNAVRLAWDRLVKRADITDLHFHDLRHEAISRFFEMGLTASEVALLSGHHDMRMLFRYSHPLHIRIFTRFEAHGAPQGVRTSL